MACKVTLCFSILFFLFYYVCGQQHEDIEKDNSVILPPCVACTTLVNSFLAKLQKNSNGYDSILAQTCSGIDWKFGNSLIPNLKKVGSAYNAYLYQIPSAYLNTYLPSTKARYFRCPSPKYENVFNISALGIW